VIRASWVGTALFAFTAIGDVVTPTFKIPAFVVAVALFVVGTGVFLGALVIAAGRSREHEIGMGGLFFLQGAADRRVQLHLLGSLAVEVAVALATAAARPYTSLAFGILVPVYALGIAGLWGARYGRFAPRVAKPRRN
jgi:hypothetical protein